MRVFATLVFCFLLGSNFSALAQSYEHDINRGGSDIRSFAVTSGSPTTCKNACDSDSACVAWTYVRPGIQANTAMCWLKGAVPAPTRDNCCISGLSAGTPIGNQLEHGYNRRGSDYTNFPIKTGSPITCQKACEEDSSCQAWTYVRPGIQANTAMCWLKDTIPGRTLDACCISGVPSGAP